MALQNLLIIFAKAPLPGRVKTRLGKSIGPVKAALAYQKILSFLLQSTFAASRGQPTGLANNHSPFDIKLYIASNKQTENEAKSEFYGAGSEHWPSVPVVLQTGDNLGQRMGHALWKESLRYRRIVLIGTDYPYLTGTVIGRLLDEEIENSPISFGPTADGGYYFVGICSEKMARCISWPTPTALVENQTLKASMAESIAQLFGGIEWSTETVLQKQIQNVNSLDIGYHLLPEGEDIDHFDDLEKFIRTSQVERIGITQRFGLPTVEIEALSALRAELKALVQKQ